MRVRIPLRAPKVKIMNGKWKRYSYHGYTEVTIRDYADIITSMGPVKVFYNDILIWDDDTDPLEWYHELLSKDILVTKITFEIVLFHHTEVYIYTR